MKNLLSFFFSFAVFSLVTAQTPTLTWVNAMAGTDNNHARTMVVDDSGNVYTTGYYYHEADFNPSPSDTLILTNLSTSDNNNIFVTKFDANGNIVWAKGIGGSNDDQGTSIALDDSGYVYVAGTNSFNIDYDPGPAVYLTGNYGGIFVLKLTNAGDYVWAKGFADPSLQGDINIALDSHANIYIAGAFIGTCDFNPDTTATATFFMTSAGTSGSQDIFVSKLTRDGNFVWAEKFGGSSPSDYAYDICVDAQDNIYFTGRTTSGTNLDWDPGAGVLHLPYSPAGNPYITKLDSAGNLKWAKTFFNYSNVGMGRSIKTDAQGNVYSTGYFTGPLDFDPGAGTYTLTTSNTFYDSYISKLDSAGNFIWAKQIGNAGTEYSYSLALDDSSNIYTSGFYTGTVDFDPNAGVFNLNSGGVYVSKLDSAGSFRWAVDISGGGTQCKGNSIAVDNNHNVITSGTFSANNDFDPSDSTYFLWAWNYYELFLHKMSQCNSFPTYMDQTACDSYTYNGQTYTTSGTYVNHFTNARGCDSTLTLNLTIHSSSAYLITSTDCVSYTSFNNATYTSTGIYHDTIPNAFGCDSIITLDLTINPVNISVTQTGNTLTSNATSPLYQWYTCNPFIYVFGWNLPYYTPSVSDDYCVVVFENGCYDTSACFNVVLVGIEENKYTNEIRISPNPFTTQTSIVFSAEQKNTEIKITDVLGKEIKTIQFTGKECVIDKGDMQRGIYFLTINSEQGITNRKVVIQ